MMCQSIPPNNPAQGRSQRRGTFGRRRLRSCLVVTTALLLVTAPKLLKGDELSFDPIPTDAESIIHIDLDRAVQSPIVLDAALSFAAQADSKALWEGIPADMRSLFQVNWHDVTIFTTSENSDEVCVIRADVDVDALTSLLKSQQDHQVATESECEIHSLKIDRSQISAKIGFDPFSSKKEDHVENEFSLHLAMVESRIIVSSNLEGVKNTVARLTGNLPSLDGSDLSQEFESVDSASVVKVIAFASASEMLPAAQSLFVSIDAQEQLHVNVQATLADREKAAFYHSFLSPVSIGKMLEGMAAQARAAAEQAKADSSDAESNEAKPKEALTSNNLKVNLSFEGNDSGEFVENLSDHFAVSLDAEQSTPTLQFAWKSFARFDTELQVEGGFMSLAITAKAFRSAEQMERVANESSDSTKETVDR